MPLLSLPGTRVRQGPGRDPLGEQSPNPSSPAPPRLAGDSRDRGPQAAPTDAPLRAPRLSRRTPPGSPGPCWTPAPVVSQSSLPESRHGPRWKTGLRRSAPRDPRFLNVPTVLPGPSGSHRPGPRGRELRYLPHAPPPPQAKVARGPLLPRPGPSRGPAPLSCPHSLSSLYHWKSAGGTAMASQRRRAARPRAVRALVTSVMVGGSGEGRGSADSHS